VGSTINSYYQLSAIRGGEGTPPLLDELSHQTGIANNLQANSEIMLSRSCLATEAVQRYQQLVLLGEPGSGKSTFVRHLAWALARRGLDQLDDSITLFGWDGQRQMLPIILSLRLLAGRLAMVGVSDETLYASLHAEIQGYDIHQADDLLREALHRGAALLLLDGLDEIPLDAIPNVTADRRTTLHAVREFARRYPGIAVVLTCRTRAFDEPLRTELGWPVETLAPFTLGQVRHFVPAWFGELVAGGQLDRNQVESIAQRLIDTIVASPKLGSMAENPLLLTMIALVLYNQGELPRDRPQLFERIIELLLGQWDKVREGQSLAEAIGLPDWGSDRLRPVLDQLSYQAHSNTTAADGRGRLARRDVRDVLERFFIQGGMRIDQAAAASVRCLDYFNQRSGLLVSDDAQDSYVFAHLVLQEHCVGRALVLDSDAVSLIMRHRTDDRWREPIFLGLGLAQRTNPALLDRVLSDLIDPDEDGLPKPVERWQRDLILAAEIGQDRDWDYIRTTSVNVNRLLRDLRRGLALLLTDLSLHLVFPERVRAGFLLGQLGDPRFPSTLEQWSAESLQTFSQSPSPTTRSGGSQKSKAEPSPQLFGQSQSYWCYIPPGIYQIGGWADDEPSANIILPDFRIARFQVTVAQYTQFVEAGYGTNTERWWTPQGWQAKQQQNLLQPAAWGDQRYARPNQPIIGVSWYEAMAFCAWLDEQLAETLPEGHVVRLPSAAEWEVAASYTGNGNRLLYPWGNEEPTPERAIFSESELSGPAPVGCCPTGNSACGALDLAGNVWEWTASRNSEYPTQSASLQRDFARSEQGILLRGGSWKDPSSSLRCGSRRSNAAHDSDDSCGFRIVIAPRSQ
jgi:formylglycine-generating enzyme required for sulfatase activity